MNRGLKYFVIFLGWMRFKEGFLEEMINGYKWVSVVSYSNRVGAIERER